MDFPECGSVRLLSLPALAHQVVDVPAARGSGWILEQAVVHVHVRQVLYHPVVGEPFERSRLGQVQDLPQGHGKRPHVALRRVLVL